MTQTFPSERSCLDCGVSGDIRYSGTPHRCRPCHRAAVKAARLANPEHYREYDKKRHTGARKECVNRRTKEWFAAHPEAATEYCRTSRAKHPEKYKARTAVGNAVRDGKLERGLCEVCGDANVHGHHDDYSKPLEVRWLCPVHHAEAHRGPF